MLFSYLLTAAFLLLFPNSSEAYLDPGTGSYMLQMLLAGALGLMFTIKLYLGKIKSFFRGLLGKENKGDESDGR